MAREEKQKAKPVKRVKNATLFSDGSMKISNVRWSFPHVVEPYVSENDEGKKTKRYKIVGMLPKKTHKAAYELITDQIEKMLKEKKVRSLPQAKKFLRDGDEEEREEYDGHWIVSASEKTRPTLRRWDEEEGRGVLCDPEDDDLDSMFYGGAWGSIWINPWFQDDKKYGKRVNANLWGVMFRAEGESFGQGRISEEDADEAFAEEDDDYDFDGASGKKSSSSKRGRDYEDEEEEDEKPRRRRSRDDDDDEEEKPRRRRRSRDEDDDDDDL